MFVRMLKLFIFCLQKLDRHVRTKATCERALALEKELMSTSRVFTVKLPDPVITEDLIRTWSSKIESTIFSKPVEPRQFLVVFKPDADVKKEVQALRNVSLGGGKLTVIIAYKDLTAVMMRIICSYRYLVWLSG